MVISTQLTTYEFMVCSKVIFKSIIDPYKLVNELISLVIVLWMIPVELSECNKILYFIYASFLSFFLKTEIVKCHYF